MRLLGEWREEEPQSGLFPIQKDRLKKSHEVVLLNPTVAEPVPAKPTPGYASEDSVSRSKGGIARRCADSFGRVCSPSFDNEPTESGMTWLIRMFLNGSVAKSLEQPLLQSAMFLCRPPWGKIGFRGSSLRCLVRMRLY
jgi:hypothetical protein